MGSHVLVRLAAEEVGRGLADPLPGLPRQHLVAVGGAPTAVDEPALAVLVGPAQALHDAIERDELDHSQFPRRPSSRNVSETESSYSTAPRTSSPTGLMWTGSTR